MKKSNKLIKSSLGLTGIIIAIKIIGFIKEIVVADVYGSTIDTDVFFLAYGFENSLTAILFSSLQITIVKTYLEELNNNGRDSSSNYISSIIVNFSLIALIVATVIFLGSGVISSLLGPKYDLTTHIVLSNTIKLFSVVTLFCPFTTTLSTVFNAENHFVKGKMSTLISNTTDVFFIVVFANVLGISARYYSFILSNIISVVLLFFMSKRFVHFRIRMYVSDERIKNLLKISFPIMIGNGATIILSLIDKSIGSLLGPGSVSVLNYSNSIYSLMISFVSTALVTVLTTYFAEFSSKKDYRGMIVQFDKISIRVIVFMALVCCVTFCLSTDFVKLIFERGQFTSKETNLVAYAIKGYIIAAFFVTIKDISIRLLYSLEKTKYPFYASIVSGIINVILSLILLRDYGVLGITIATAISEVVATIMCFCFLKKTISFFSIVGFIKKSLPVIASGLISFSIMLIINTKMSSINAFGRITAVIFTGSISYFCLLRIFGVSDVFFFRNYLSRFICKNK